jgi:transcriptional regulator
VAAAEAGQAVPQVRLGDLLAWHLLYAVRGEDLMRAIDLVLEQHSNDERVRVIHQHYQAMLDGFEKAADVVNMLWEHIPDHVGNELIKVALLLVRQTDNAGASVMRAMAETSPQR